MFKPSIRVATNGDGERIRELLDENYSGLAEIDLDWSDLNGNWLVAMDGDRAIGCLQVCPGKPVGYIDNLGLAAELSTGQRGITTREITEVGCTTLRIFGSEIASSFIPGELVDYIKQAEKRNWTVFSDGKSLLRRLL